MIPQPLFDHIQQYTNVAEADKEAIASYFSYKKVRKKEEIMFPYGKCNANHFVLKGCLYMYFTNDKGAEQTLQFGIENWWITDYLAFYHQKTTEFGIKAVETSEILILTHQKQTELLEKHPEMEKYFRVMYQIAYGAATNRLKYIFNYSKEDIFFKFREQFPEFVNRVPQYLVATYLGLTPEYVSQLRNKSVS